MIADPGAAQQIIDKTLADEQAKNKEHVAPEAISPETKSAKNKLLDQLDALEKEAGASKSNSK